MHEITPELLKRIVPAMPLSKRRLYAPLIQAACVEFDITTEARVAGFLAQCAHESDSFNTLQEYASGAAYDRRKDLGNTQPEAIAAAKRHNTTPGRFYKGHGAIQTTGYYNHVKAGEALGIDAVEEPGLLATPEHAFRSAGFFWKSHHLNKAADKHDILGMTKIVNGGTNGLAQRKAFYERALIAMPDGFELTAKTQAEPAEQALPTAIIGGTVAPVQNEVVVPPTVPADAGSKKSLWAMLLSLPGLAIAWVSSNVGEAFGWLKDKEFLKYAIIVAGAIVIVYLLRQIVMSVVKQVGAIQLTRDSMRYHADPNSNNVVVGQPAPPKEVST
jgi:putative chitinase